VTAPGDPGSGLDALRLAYGEVLGAERRLRGRDQQRHGDLTWAQVVSLVTLADREQMTAGELARAAGLNPASVTGMLDQLERDGIVERRRSEADRRSVLVSLTARGREVLDDRRRRWRSLWEERLGHVPDDELRSAARVLRDLAAMLDGL